VPVMRLNVGGRPPGRVGRLGIPGLERLLRVSMRGLLPEIPQRPFGDDAHRVFFL
jgi:hypothetical protein